MITEITRLKRDYWQKYSKEMEHDCTVDKENCGNEQKETRATKYYPRRRMCELLQKPVSWMHNSSDTQEESREITEELLFCTML